MNKGVLRQAVLWVMVGGFPLLYLSAVTIESTLLAVASLIVVGVAAAVAALVY